eukprot:15448976-Alexandrium_andersonii.AAC.1
MSTRTLRSCCQIPRRGCRRQLTGPRAGPRRRVANSATTLTGQRRPRSWRWLLGPRRFRSRSRG